MAAGNALGRKKRAFHGSVAADRFIGVFRATRIKTATRPEHRADAVLVAADQRAQDNFQKDAFTSQFFRGTTAGRQPFPWMFSVRTAGAPASRRSPTHPGSVER